MDQWFRHTVDKETNSDTGRKDHGKVGRGGELRWFVLRSELDMTELVGNPEQEEEKNTFGTNKDPGEVVGHVTTPLFQQLVGACWVDCESWSQMLDES